MYYRYAALQDIQNISGFGIGLVLMAFTVGIVRSFTKSLLPEHQSNIVWAEIDPNIRWVVREFRRRGYNTISSCEGHLEQGMPAYVSLKVNKGTYYKLDQIGKKYFEEVVYKPPLPGYKEYTRWFEGHPADLVLHNDMTTRIELWPPMPPLRKEEVISKESWIETANRFWHWIFEVLSAI